MEPNLHNIQEIKISHIRMGFSITIIVNTTLWIPSEFKHNLDQILTRDNINPKDCTFEICRIRYSKEGKDKSFDRVWTVVSLEEIYNETNYTAELNDNIDKTHKNKCCIIF